MHKILCMNPGRDAKNIANILGIPLWDRWIVVGNPLREATKTLWIFTAYNNGLCLSEVPLSRIRIITEADAYALRVCTNPAVKKELIDSMLRDT